jgi:hypothetical protein
MIAKQKESMSQTALADLRRRRGPDHGVDLDRLVAPAWSCARRRDRPPRQAGQPHRGRPPGNLRTVRRKPTPSAFLLGKADPAVLRVATACWKPCCARHRGAAYEHGSATAPCRRARNQPAHDHDLDHARHHHPGAGRHHRQRRAAAHAGQPVGLAGPDHLGADLLHRGRRHRHAAERLAGATASARRTSSWSRWPASPSPRCCAAWPAR